MSDSTSSPNPNKMAPDTLYTLEMLFNGAEISTDELKTKAEVAIARPAPEVELSVAATEDRSLLLSLCAPLDDADECHARLNKKLLSGESSLSCVRLKDDAGDEARRLAYLILSRIEMIRKTIEAASPILEQMRRNQGH